MKLPESFSDDECEKIAQELYLFWLAKQQEIRMSFDLERAKKEGCIFWSEGEQKGLLARILCDDLNSSTPVVVRIQEEDGRESLARLSKDGTMDKYTYLKNKPKRLEVRIYKNNKTGLYYSTTEIQDWVHRDEEDEWSLVKTIEVEI